MSSKTVARIPTYPLEHPYFSEIAHMVELPVTDPDAGIQFFPAIDGFETGSVGSEKIDISYLYVPYHRDSLCSFDKHPHNEELFVVLQGSFHMIAGLSKHGEFPRIEELRCFYVKEGDIFIQKRNVWHTACWPVNPEIPVRYLMVLSGHRSLNEEEVKVDHYIRELPDNYAVIPDFPE